MRVVFEKEVLTCINTSIRLCMRALRYTACRKEKQILKSPYVGISRSIYLSILVVLFISRGSLLIVYLHII